MKSKLNLLKNLYPSEIHNYIKQRFFSSIKGNKATFIYSVILYTNCGFQMADESLIEFLHAELIKYVTDNTEEKGDISKLEYLGYITGFRIIERLTKEWPPFKNELDTMKFLCTDFWSSIYKKQIDNLRTNHHGVYVLQDNAFRYLVRLSSQKQYLEVAPKFVAFTCGLVRGALANLGITCLVTAEVEHMPACKFHIQVQRA